VSPDEEVSVYAKDQEEEMSELFKNNTVLGQKCLTTADDIQGCLVIGDGLELPEGSRNRIRLKVGGLHIMGDIPEGFAKKFGEALQGCTAYYEGEE